MSLIELRSASGFIHPLGRCRARVPACLARMTTLPARIVESCDARHSRRHRAGSLTASFRREGKDVPAFRGQRTRGEATHAYLFPTTHVHRIHTTPCACRHRARHAHEHDERVFTNDS